MSVSSLDENSSQLPPSSWPLLGLGTCCEEPEEVAAQVTSAIDAGYRFIDTAAHYPGESAVGEALACNCIGVAIERDQTPTLAQLREDRLDA